MASASAPDQQAVLAVFKESVVGLKPAGAGDTTLTYFVPNCLGELTLETLLGVLSAKAVYVEPDLPQRGLVNIGESNFHLARSAIAKNKVLVALYRDVREGHHALEGLERVERSIQEQQQHFGQQFGVMQEQFAVLQEQLRMLQRNVRDQHGELAQVARRLGEVEQRRSGSDTTVETSAAGDPVSDPMSVSA